MKMTRMTAERLVFLKEAAAHKALIDMEQRAEAAEVKLVEYEEWFDKNATVLAVHGIGGFMFEKEQTK